MRVRFTRRPRRSRFSNPDARLYDLGVALSASRCCLMALETCSSFPAQVAIRCCRHSPFGLRRLILCATSFEQRGRFAGNRLTRRSSYAAGPVQFHLKRPLVDACGADRRPDFNRMGGRARAADRRFVRLDVLGHVIWVNARRICPFAGPSQLEGLLNLTGKIEPSRARS